MKAKTIWTLSRADAAKLLRALAKTIEEGGDEVEGFGIQLAEVLKFKLKFTHLASDTFEVKFTGRFAAAEEEESYSKLKKRMQIYFKGIRQSVSQEEMPSRELVSVFLADARTMTMWPGYGDAMYPVFLEACQRLEQAVEQNDIPSISSCIQELDEIRKLCHSQYK
jgi:XXXCH domain-containing protein